MDEPLPSLTARVVDPEGAAAADDARTADCAHPPASSRRYLNCVHCGVWILDGKVVDRGRTVVANK